MLKKRVATLGAALMLALTACSSATAADNDTAAPQATGTSTGTAAKATSSSEKPNIVFVLVDDMDSGLLKYLPSVQQMQEEGTSFSDYYVSNSLCCASRSTIFTGMYPHNTGIFTNTVETGGGYVVFKGQGLDQDTFATDLQGAGYQTAIMGKFLNEYQPGSPKKPTTTNPVGWDEWALSASGYNGFNYNLNENGEVTHYGKAEDDYLTDVISAKGQDFIKRSAGSDEPFFLEMSVFTPHKPAVPAPRHAELYPNLKAPRTATYDKKNKNPATWMANQKISKASAKTMDEEYRRRAQTLASVDEMITALRAQLTASGVADNTYIVFSSDNGYHMGEHKLVSGKMTAFDTDINVPLVVLGPDVPAGRTTDAMASNIDLRPTFTDMANTTSPSHIDGQSLVPLWSGGSTPVTDRKQLLVEHKGIGLDDNDPDQGIFRSPIPPDYAAIRSKDFLYVKYNSGDREYYDLKKDPNETDNIAGSLSAKRIKQLDATVHKLRACSGQKSCSKAEALG
ncbi:sulfatase [Kineosporia sp. J2-2]|uniref:Sulfatase n=1 Tax=Kineosporia corallincola TaxID=2835133 RepID=A0ABS5TIP8_9ACTN|nr:sulfatase [Kineosporia corallincola]MBT0769449.1 sulfatase [Kineosporia corallincola]